MESLTRSSGCTPILLGVTIMEGRERGDKRSSVSRLLEDPLDSRMDFGQRQMFTIECGGFQDLPTVTEGDIVGSSSDPLASDSSISQDKSDGRRNTNPLNLAQSDIRFGTRNDRVQDRIDYHWVNILQV